MQNLLRKLTFIKTLNLFKLLLSYLISISIKKPLHWGMPASVGIEPTNNCNLACPECPVGNKSLTRIRENIDINLHHRLINEIGKYLFSILYYFQGEPFLNPQLFEMIKVASTREIYTICSTNGHFLNNENAERVIKSGLDKLIISLDGTSSETYQQYRVNGSFDKVIEGIKTMVNKRIELKSNSPQIVLQFLVLKSNQHQIAEAKRSAKNLGVDKIVFKSAQIYHYKNGSPLIPDIGKYARYKKKADGTYAIKSKLKNRCWRMWINPVITASGQIAVCCFDKNAQFGLGDIKHGSFSKIWHSEKYKNFRLTILNRRKTVDICTNCTEGLSKFLS